MGGLSLFGSLGPYSQMFAEIRQLDTEATESLDNFDHVLREPKKYSEASGSTSGLRYKEETVTVKGQVENTMSEKERLSRAGDLPDTFIRLVLSRSALKLGGFIDSDGRVEFQKGDRLIRIKRANGEIVQTFDRPPGGLYCTQVKHGDAYVGMDSNQIHIEFEDRPKGVRI